MRLVWLLLLIPSLAFAAKPCPCEKTAVKHKAAKPCYTATVVPPETQAKPKAESSSYDGLGALMNGFSVTSGFRWDRACPDPTALKTGVAVATQVDPFFVGVEERVPLSSWADVGGNFDRDFTDAPHWSARAFVALRPWRK